MTAPIISVLLGVLLAGTLLLFHRERAAHRSARAAAEDLTRDIGRLEAFHLAQTNLNTDAIIQLSASRRVMAANRAARAIFGDPPPTAGLMDWVKHPQLVDIVAQTLDNRLDITHQFEYRERVFKARAAAVTGGGEVIGAVLILTDVSELQRLGRARRDFVANISHDLRTPIAGLRLVAETLLGGALDDPSMARHLTQKIVDETDALQQINEELMDLSLIESGRMPLVLVPLNLTKRVKKEVKRLQNMADRKQVELVIDLPKKIKILADKGMLSRVLTNLIHNAIKFTAQGQVKLSARLEPGGDMVCLMVSDTGIGISPADRGRIFERFYKSDDSRARESEETPEPHKTGTGLGLAIVRHIVEAHGGRIWVDSVLGKGSTFYLTLPLEETPAGSAA
ncbi:MAG: sensor histidine kinase [Anaerolineae bacterium]